MAFTPLGVRPRAPPVRSCRSQLDYDPITVESYRATDLAFTTRVEPGSPPWIAGPRAGRKLVEAPGTAPGSATLISQAVYRHSRLPDVANVGWETAPRNAARARGARRPALEGRCTWLSQAGPGAMLHRRAGVAEWQTRQTQNLLSERTWEFKSPRPHQLDQRLKCA
jgi:hypothetical protein